jgi:hypothetical protein
MHSSVHSPTFCVELIGALNSTDASMVWIPFVNVPVYANANPCSQLLFELRYKRMHSSSL